jgi:hypothetical protein
LTDLESAIAMFPRLCVLGVLLEDVQHMTPSAARLASWATSHQVDFPVAIGDTNTANVLGPLMAYPTNLIVDPVTMHLLNVVVGYDMTLVSQARMLCGF